MTRTAQDVTAATAALAQWRPHLTVIDMDFARGALLDRLAAPEPSGERIPVVALTPRGDLQTKLAAFEWGVDDILTVPFSPEELVARILAVLRRAYRTAIPFTPTIRLGELEIDILNRRVRVDTTELHLTALEQSLLYLLAANAGRVLSRDEILDALWGADYVAPPPSPWRWCCPWLPPFMPRPHPTVQPLPLLPSAQGIPSTSAMPAIIPSRSSVPGMGAICTPSCHPAATP